MRRSAALVVTAVLAASVTPADANGRPPSSVKVVFRPGSTTDILLGVTFGLMLTRDDGATWRWICESAVGFEGTFDPDYELSASGAIWATTFGGLRTTRDGCTWSGVDQPLGPSLVTAVEIAGDGAIYAGLADPVAGSGIYKSTDDGMTFDATGDLGGAVDWFDSIETSPSAPDVVYVAGYRLRAGMPPQNLIFRSVNGGATWESLPVTAFEVTDVSNLQLAAISPTDPDELYVRVTLARATIGETIYRTSNWRNPLAMGGPTWTKVLDLPDYIPGVAVRQNGEVFATTPTMGLHRSTDGGLTFTAVPGVTYEGRCLAERPSDQSMWMCANHLPPDSMALGRSPDGTTGWMARLRYADMAGPVRCEAGTDQHDDCEVNLWCGTKDQFGVTSDEIDCSGDAGIDGPGTPPPKDGCCNSSTAPGGKLGLAFLVLAALVLRSRRWRPRR
ncbi:MAG: hypothetical protein K8M05_17690 [Deltaproteobacteria bacterium]|nr:hypothetical protein [Kofleriaceae bacterium]